VIAQPLELDAGKSALTAIIEANQSAPDWNEADTRLQIIDRLLLECLGWPREWWRLEKHADSGYADYVLGQPPVLVLEAKRVGSYFEIPVSGVTKPVRSIKSLTDASAGLKDAMVQALQYCASLGVEYGAVCNGFQLVAFIAVRHDQPPLEGRALVIDGWEAFQRNFSTVWQNLSPWALRERRLTRTLTVEAEAALPPKLASTVLNFHAHRYKNRLQSNLRDLAEFLINDIPFADDLREQFYRECYCDTGQLSQYIQLSERILKARYAALFRPDQTNPVVMPISTARQLPALEHDKNLPVDALTRRPIVLLGDRGVGKSSFLENLITVRAKEAFAHTLYVMIDLGTKGALTHDIRDFILNEIERQLLEKHSVDIYDKKFVRSIYDLEVKRFKKTIFAASSKQQASEDGPTGINDFLIDQAKNKVEHIKKSISHIAKGRKRQVVVIVDNADQRNSVDQQEAFLAAQEIAADWSALVYVALRPQTFNLSKQAGTLSAYANRIFTISPPPPDVALEKRLTFALGVAEGRIHPAALERISLDVDSITTVLKVLLRSIHANRDIKAFIANITGGNIRQLFEIFTMFIGSPNVEFQKIIEIDHKQGRYLIPLHEFQKHALLGEFEHYSPTTSLACNLFDVFSNDGREHFLSPLILAYLRQPGPHRDVDGFVTTRDLLSQMQGQKFLQNQIRSHLQRLLRKNLIESVGRVGMDLHWSEQDEIDILSGGYRITSIGSYHLIPWMTSFAYLDAMAFDTPIFDYKSFETMARLSNSFAIGDRLKRTEEFSHYLTRQWHSSSINVSYFDWTALEQTGAASFDPVRRVVQKNESPPNRISGKSKYKGKRRVARSRG
jgi:hypothetical protein